VEFCRRLNGEADFEIAHHTSEEESFFPRIENDTGEKGIMDGNIEQHRLSQSQFLRYFLV
jgi:hemerythrin superfamily protein